MACLTSRGAACGGGAHVCQAKADAAAGCAVQRKDVSPQEAGPCASVKQAAAAGGKYTTAAATAACCLRLRCGLWNSAARLSAWTRDLP